MPPAGPAARALRLVRAGAALLPRARAAAGAAQPAPPRAAGLPPALLPLLLALLLQVPPGAPREAASTCPSVGACGGRGGAGAAGKEPVLGGEAMLSALSGKEGEVSLSRGEVWNETKANVTQRSVRSARCGRDARGDGPAGRRAAAVPLAQPAPQRRFLPVREIRCVRTSDIPSYVCR